MKGLGLVGVVQRHQFAVLPPQAIRFSDTEGGAEGVGRSTTRAVVYSAVLILVLDAFWAAVLLR